MRWHYIVAGLWMMLLSAYLDNVRGPTMPLLNRVLHLQYAQSSWLLVGGYLAAIGMALGLLPLAKRFGERTLSLALAGLGLFAVSLSFVVSGLPSLVLFSVFVGCTIAGFGSLSNLLTLKGTTPEYRSRFLCGLHMMYGVGSFLAPLAVAAFVDWGWKSSFWIMIPAIGLLLAQLVLFVPTDNINETQAQSPSVRLSGVQLLVLFIFACYVAGEVMCSMWMVPYLVDVTGRSLQQSTSIAAGFFIMMALTRMICFFGMRPSREKWVMILCLVAGVASFIAGRSGFVIGFSLAGLVGPYFPLLLARVSNQFPEQMKALTLWVIATMQITLCVLHFSVGNLSEMLGVSNLYWLPVVFLSLALLGFGAYLHLESKRMPSSNLFSATANCGP